MIDGTVYQAGVVVVSQLTIEAMLGLDFMRRDNVSIDLGETKMKIGQEAPISIEQSCLPKYVDGVSNLCLEQSNIV